MVQCTSILGHRAIGAYATMLFRSLIRMMILLLSLSLSAASLDAATAAPAATTGVSKPAKPAKPKKVCQKVEVTGSTVPKRVCRIVAEPAKPAPDAARADGALPSDGAAN
jgi:hypothetical protein